MSESRDVTVVQDGQLDRLLHYLKEARGFDFGGYRRSTLERRIQNRMEVVGAGSYQDYQDALEVTPNEFKDLFDTILVNVTGFFRDKPAWDFLAADVIPRVLEKPAGSPIRVWSAGSSSGEEAYSVAILFAEALGEEELGKRVKIYATDVDEDALTSARRASFTAESLKSVPEPLRDRYFERATRGYSVRADVRGSVVFGRNDLVQDAPISHVDLLVSRNSLIYFTRETQTRILARFNFALEGNGFLFVGKSEMLPTHTDLFVPHNLQHRVFTKVPTHGFQERLAAMQDGPEPGRGRADLSSQAADAVPIAHVLVDRSGIVVGVNHRARDFFSLGPEDIGRPFQDLELSYRPLDLRSALQRAYTDGKTVELGQVDWVVGGQIRTLSVEVNPLLSQSGDPQGAGITFQDITELAALDAKHNRAQQLLETAYRELQATVEELETTNEELQSTNEELETTNEELQSTNEQLGTMNEEQRTGARDRDRLNLFLDDILGHLGFGVVVLDTDERVQVWNPSAAELWGLRADEAEGKLFFSLDIGLPMDELEEAIRNVLTDPPASGEVVVAAVNRRGRAFTCSVRTLPLTSPDGRNHGAILLMGERDGAS